MSGFGATWRARSQSAQRDFVQLAAAVCFAWVAVRLVTFAVWIGAGVPPDEVDHVGRALAHAETLWLPADSPESFAHGLISNRPFLYNWLMGRVLDANVFGISELLWLRLANVVLTLGVVFYGWRWIRLVSGRPDVQVLFLVLLTNTLMFTGLGASVTYDNLTHLLAAVGIYHLFAFFQRRRPEDLLWLGVAIGAGCLTKRTFLPLAALVGVTLILWEGRSLCALIRRREWMPTRRLLPLAIAATLFFFGNAILYGGNLMRFGSLIPEADQVLTVRQAMQNRIFARNRVVDLFRQGELEFKEAVAIASRIEHPGNRHRALTLLNALRDPQALEASRVSLDRYVHLWGHIMISRMVGYQGNPSVPKRGVELQLYLLVFGLAALGFVRFWRPPDRWATVSAVLMGGYALILLLLVNYPTYLRYGLVDYQVNGRYLFPVLIPLYGLVAHYLLAPFPRRVRAALALAVAVLFVYGDLPWFILHASRCHFAGVAAAADCPYQP